MTVTLTAAGCYQVLRCALRGRPRRLPPGWEATQIGVNAQRRQTTWLLHDPRTHNVANILGPQPAALRRQLLAGGCQPVTADLGHTVYIVGRDPDRRPAPDGPPVSLPSSFDVAWPANSRSAHKRRSPTVAEQASRRP